ncbi:MAG: glycosyltransferase family 39 protein [Nanoarchaeota archaeon]|nr:glycosyltransferase family 39 protein [Nanoarchaeota archaeon]
MNKKQAVLLILVCVGIFLIVYSPHFSCRFPLHIDEWHHIRQAIRLGNGNYETITHYSIMGRQGISPSLFEIGFDIPLFLLSKLFNLVLIWQFLPAIWAVISALVIFFIIKKKTDNCWIALFSIIFFASLKSNVNILGMWFFVPLVFSIPLIFLYIYLFSEGLQNQNKKFILISVVIIALLLFIHPISFLFSLPFLLIYLLFHAEYIRKEWKFFLLLLSVPILGIIFYSFVFKLSLINSVFSFFEFMQFRKNAWGILEAGNSFFEVYSLLGCILAVIGGFVIFYLGKSRKYLVFLLWPVTLLISMLIFKLFEVSYLVPFQKNLYYFALSLPFLSSIGLYYSIKLIARKIERQNLRKLLSFLIVTAVLLAVFYNYSDTPKNYQLYQIINETDYSALLFLKNLESGRVLAEPLLSSAILPVSGKEAVALTYYSPDFMEVYDFFKKNCSFKNQFLAEKNVSYVFYKKKINCDWKEVYSDKVFIYDVRNLERE